MTSLTYFCEVGVHNHCRKGRHTSCDSPHLHLVRVPLPPMATRATQLVAAIHRMDAVMSGQFPPGDTRGTDPHADHYLEEGPTRLGIQWLGVCRCGQEFRGLTAEDIYAKSQLHINRHVIYPDGGAA